MLKVGLNGETHVADIRATGTLMDITADVGYLIRTLYNGLAPEGRAWFRRTVSEIVSNPKSHVWEAETGGSDGILGVTICIPNPGREE